MIETNTNFDFCAEKTIKEWNEATGIDSKALFIALGQTVINVGMGDVKGGLEKSLELLNAFESKDEALPAPVLAWQLINVAISKSIFQLLQENDEFLEIETQKHGVEDLAVFIVKAMDSKPIGINSDFFDEPRRLTLIRTLEQPLQDWLIGLGIPPASAKAMFLRLEDKFVTHLHREWTQNPNKYHLLEEAINSPFLKSAKKQRDWKLYSNWLQEESNKPVFSEAFGLRQVYVKLNGYYDLDEPKYETNNKHKPASTEEHKLNTELAEEKEQRVVDVHEDIYEWVTNFDKDSAIKVICGGPGSGKSSLAKVIAADIPRIAPNISVLFIPLQYFDISSDLTSAVGQFVQDDIYLSTNPLDGQAGEDRLLIIFDGLDELSMQGKVAAESARYFVEEVITKINRFNDQGLQRQAIITGRDIAIQACEEKLRGVNQVLHLLPYDILEHKRHRMYDPNNLLDIDLRDSWWKKYSEAKGFDYTELPRELSSDDLYPITVEPLLNYLVALTYERGELDFSKEISLNEVYGDLIKSVHQRQWDRGYYKGTENLAADKFERVLEEIALAVWHGHGRTATLASIETQCRDSNLLKHLQKFEQSAESGISRLLTAFYFRQSEKMSGTDKTFEFTHKSFGEFLISRRLVTLLKKIQLNISRYDEDPDDGYSEREALKNWTKICGLGALDDYIITFLSNEILSYDEKQKAQWHKTIGRLLKYALEKGMPMEELGRLSYVDMERQSSASLTALIVVHGLCGKHTGNYTEFSDGVDIIQVINHIEYVTHNEDIPASYYLGSIGITNRMYCARGANFLSLRNSMLNDVLFDDCVLICSNLTRSILTNVRFVDSNLRECALIGSELENSSFGRTILNDADFESVEMKTVHFNSSKATGADFTYLIANDVEISKSDFSASCFEQATMAKSIFRDCSLLGIDFDRATLSSVEFANSDLQKAYFADADLEGVSFKNSPLDGARFDNSTIKNTSFSEAQLAGADFHDAWLENVDFCGADLSEADFTGVDLTKVQLDSNTKLDGLLVDEVTKFSKEHSVFLEGVEFQRDEVL
ncbi:hypothetical protein VISI1226_07463 [Vibrio sinaloensis DSM 21326]|uniref:NACHT N-terminal Helical domain-containing protein n=1 Tax=Vibrio sinaloensis DSM 21326 TaxID=945550 RepID=E8MAH7_PHOS4|nr:pentapeptide repeat-containing protein [Vibrio sinaloensis]EGA69126.1 hypothetical protein VISI1226_07463 [Vibrio sinaloensis DSM 21326]